MSIKEARIAAGLTQKEMSDLLEIPKRTIEDWEAGRRKCAIWAEKLIVEKLERISEEKQTGGTNMKYIVMDCTDTDMFNESFETAEEAVEQAELDWSRMSDYDKNRRTEYYVLESANPDEEAEDHFDGDIIKRWK